VQTSFQADYEAIVPARHQLSASHGAESRPTADNSLVQNKMSPSGSPHKKSACIRPTLHPASRYCSTLKYSRYSRVSSHAIRSEGPRRCNEGLSHRLQGRTGHRDSVTDYRNLDRPSFWPHGTKTCLSERGDQFALARTSALPIYNVGVRILEHQTARNRVFCGGSAAAMQASAFSPLHERIHPLGPPTPSVLRKPWQRGQACRTDMKCNQPRHQTRALRHSHFENVAENVCEFGHEG
jgi:hypothetical protein